MDRRKAIIRNGKIVYGKGAVVDKPAETQARARRQDMRTKHRKDLLQRNQVEYYRANPEQAKNLSPELRRLLS